MAVEMLTSALPMMNGARMGHDNKKAEYRLRKHRLEKLDSTISELPVCFDEWLNSLNGYCTAGSRLASLLEAVLEETPLLMTVSQYKEACEQLNDKCKRMEIHLQPEFVSACKKVGPCISQLRSTIGTHAKSLSKYESAQSQYENINSDSASKAKIDQAETKFKNALQEFVNQDKHLAEATGELDRLRVESMGSCFLSLLEAQSSMLTSALEVMGPLGSYKEVGQRLIDSKTTSVVKEATLGWLAAAQVYRNLRTFGTLSRNDIQCMMFGGGEGIPDTIRKGLNNKVDQLLKLYLGELEKTVGTPRILPGGFHHNPKGIELALKDCCSELEAVGAGASHVQEREEKREQIDRDIPRTVFLIGGKKLDVAFGRAVQENVKDKLACLEQLVSGLPIVEKERLSTEQLHEFSLYALNETCTTVTNTSAKTAVQLVYGKANLILVRASPNPEDFHPVEVTTKGDSTLLVSVRSTWWLVEDYATLAYLSRLPSPESYIGIVHCTYSIELSLHSFLSKKPEPQVPTLSVECSEVSHEYFTTIQYPSPGPPNVPATRKSKIFRSKIKKDSSFQSYMPQNDDLPQGRLPSSEGEGLTDGGSSHHSSHGNSPSEHFPRSTDRSHGNRGGRPGLYKASSIDSLSTVTSGVTLKAGPQTFEDEITDFLRTEVSGRGLTEDKLKVLSRSNKRYSKQRKDNHLGAEGNRDHKREEWERTLDNTDKGGPFSNKQPDQYSPGNPDDYPDMYEYQDRGYRHYYGDKNVMGGAGMKEGFEEDNKDGGQQSQVMEQDGVRSHNPQMMSNAPLSADSGIVMHPRNVGGNGRYHDDRGDGMNMGIGPYFMGRSIGPYVHPVSSDSESESPSGGRDSRNIDKVFGGYRNTSTEDIHRRSSSSASSHGPHQMVGLHNPVEQGDSLSLPDKIDYNRPLLFDQAPGSHLIGHGHQRHSSISSTSSDFAEQDRFDRMPVNSFSQDDPLQSHGGRDDRFSGSYDGRGHPSQYHHYGSDPYPNPQGNFPPERQSRSLNRSNGRMMPPDEYSPGPPMMRHAPGPPGGPGMYWDNYPPSGHHAHLHGPPGGPHHHGPHRVPPFHHMGGYGPNTSDIPSSSSSLSSLSPAPSPHPTPPTTPPPPLHPSMIQMGPSPMRMAPPQRMPHPIGPGHRPVMPPPMEFQDFHMQRPHLQRAPPPGPHLQGGGPPHHNHIGPPHPPHPQHMHQFRHNRGPMPGPSDWEQNNWKRHP